MGKSAYHQADGLNSVSDSHLERMVLTISCPLPTYIHVNKI